MQFDNILQQVGGSGPYQILMLCLLLIPASITSAFLVFSQLFITASPDHWCKIPYFNNSTGKILLMPEEQRKIAIPTINEKYDNCHMYSIYGLPRTNNETQTINDRPDTVGQPEQNLSGHIISCPEGWNYDKTSYESTLVTKFDIVCEKSWMTTVATSFFYAGSLVGNILFGWVSDRFGRRFSFFCILVIEVVFSIAATFSTSFEVYTILRFFCGLCFPSLYQVSFILALELMGPNYRTMVGMVICVSFALSEALLAILSYYFRDWFHLSLATSVPFVLLFSYFWILPESPRWLISRNRIEEAEKIVQKIAKTNHKKIPTNFLTKLMEETSPLNNGSPMTVNSEPERVVYLIEILKYPRMRLRFIIITFDWIANAVVYNGLSQNVSNLGIGDRQAFFIGGLVEIPGHIIAWYLINNWGRRPVLCISMFFGGLACMACVFISEDSRWITLLLAMIGKFGNAASFGTFYVFVGELLPTVIRSQAIGIASFVGGLGLTVLPYIIRLGQYNKSYPLIIMGFLSSCGGAMSILLPETRNIPLPQNMDDSEALTIKSPLSFLTGNKKENNRVEEEQEKCTSTSNGIELEEISAPAKANINPTSRPK